MKISKLFHWLYAILMLLPFAFFVPSVLYYAFNDNATMQSVEVPKTETISVDFNQQLHPTSWRSSYCTYTEINGAWEITFNYSVNNPEIFRFNGGTIVNNHKYYLKTDSSLGNKYIRFWGDTKALGDFFYTDINYKTYTQETQSNINNCYIIGSFNVNDVVKVYNNLFDVTQMYGVGNIPNYEVFKLQWNNDYYPYTESELMQITYDTGETEQLAENTSIINYAWESIWDLPLFSWTKVTFVSVPFSYLTGIFGIGANNSLNYVFGYFVTISIVWLVFDLLLYVPMLAHNWIDKARIE